MLRLWAAAAVKPLIKCERLQISAFVVAAEQVFLLIFFQAKRKLNNIRTNVR